MKYFAPLFLIALISACNSGPSDQPAADDLTQYSAPTNDNALIAASEKWHRKAEFLQQEAISFDFELYFMGKRRLGATVTMTTDSKKVRIDREDGAVLVFDGEQVGLYPDTATWKNPRFDIFTWSYFFGLPYKLSDPGTQFEALKPERLGDIIFPVGELTFSENTGDSPDDWYRIFFRGDDSRVEAAAYIVTYSQSAEKANEDPHVILYRDYWEIGDGWYFPHTWEFRNWREGEGDYLEQLGEGCLWDIHFVQPEKGFFDISEGSRVVER